jgi:hypothetical protein
VRQFLTRVHRERAPLYRDVATMVIRNPPDVDPAGVADRIVEAVHRQEQQ